MFQTVVLTPMGGGVAVARLRWDDAHIRPPPRLRQEISKTTKWAAMDSVPSQFHRYT